MPWKDLSELHLASLRTKDDTLFDQVLGGKIAEAIWKIDNRVNTPLLFKSDSRGIGSESDLNKSFPVYTVGDIKEQTEGDSEEGWYCPLFMKAGEITLFCGEAKRSGKTTFYLHMLKAVHDGTPFMGMPTTKADGLILTEQGSNILEATTKAGIQDTDRIFLALYKDLSRVEWSETMEKAISRCGELGVEILVVDTFTAFAKLRGSDENLSGEIIARMEPVLDAARVHGLHVSVLHHTGKDGDIRGSSAFRKDPDVIWVLKRPSGDHAPNIRALEGLGRYDAVNTSFNVALEDAGYVLLGTNAQIERSKAKGSLLEQIPRGRENARRRTEVIDAVANETNVSKATIQRALENLVERHTVRQEALQERGTPTVLWRHEAHILFKSDTQGRPPESDSNKTPVDESAYISDASGLEELITRVTEANILALDLETMPPPGWRSEVLAEYCSQLSKLKKRPKVEPRRTRLNKIKEKTYKDYATNPATAQPRLISLAMHDGLNVLVDVAAVDPSPLLDVLKDKTLITHHGAFDLGVLRERYGYRHAGHVMDTQLLFTLHHYAESGRRIKFADGMKRLPDPRDTKIDLYGTGRKDVGMSALAAVAKQYLGEPLHKGSQASDWSVPNLSDEQLSYALRDTEILIDLSDELVDKLTGIGMGAIVKLESRTFPALVDMALNGFPADKTVALEMAEKYRREAQTALAKVRTLLPQDTAPHGKAWNWNSDAHIRAVLRLLDANIDKKGYPKTDKTKEPSTAAKALRTIKSPTAACEWVDAYLAYDGLQKISGDFASKYARLIQEDGTIKGSFDTVSTGRLSCRKPNLQQVPKRGEQQTKEGMRIRDIFRPAEGDVFIIADFAQVELLLAATIAKRETGKRGHMLEVFQQGKDDIHKVTAASLTGRPVSKVTSAERSLAKAVNFGLVYGAEAETLMEYARDNYSVDMSLEDSKAYRKAFFERYPELEAWHRLVEACCDRDEEYSTTPMGRRRKLPRWISSGKIAHTTAKNAPVQGTGADAIKLTLAKLFEDRHNCPGNPRLNVSVHDEVVLSIVEEHAATAVEWVEKHMADAEREAVGDPESPVVVEVEAKKSWA